MDRRRAPEVATPRAMASTIAAFYAVGGVAGLLVTLGSEASGPTHHLLFALSLSALASAFVVHRWGRHWPRRAFHATIGSAAVLVDCAVLVSPDAASAVVAAAFTSFLVFDSLLFFRRRTATVHLVLALTGVTVALLVQGDVPLPTALALVLVMTALGAVTRRLVERASGASRDPLTDLLNRRGFDQALQEQVDALPRTGDRMSAVLLDLDDFKAVNDSHGHDAGDQVLRQVADTWSQALPAEAVFARHGGDEFGVLLPGWCAEQTRDLVQETCRQHPDTRLSAGVAEYSLGDSGAQLMRRADQALYAAKAAGRGRCEVAGQAAPDLVRDLATALETGGVHVVFQPLVGLADGVTVGVEALARWDRPGHGPVSPLEFVAVAEAHGLIGVLGETVLRSACSQLAALHASTGKRLRLGINASGLELSDPEYPERVRTVLAETGWPAGETVLEVTESVLDADSLTSVATLHSLRALGVLVAIDDFGTGYSSLSRLDTLPADILKVDAAFTATITTSPRRGQMLRSIAGLADALGLDLVAEGVETTEQLELVRSVGCTYVQGWLTGRPQPLGELTRALGTAASRTVHPPR